MVVAQSPERSEMIWNNYSGNIGQKDCYYRSPEVQNKKISNCDVHDGEGEKTKCTSTVQNTWNVKYWQRTGIGHFALINLFNSQKNPHYPHPTNEKTETWGAHCNRSQVIELKLWEWLANVGSICRLLWASLSMKVGKRRDIRWWRNIIG